MVCNMMMSLEIHKHGKNKKGRVQTKQLHTSSCDLELQNIENDITVSAPILCKLCCL